MSISAQRKLCRCFSREKDMKQRKMIRELCLVTVSTAMIAAATCCYVRSGLGSDSVAVFNEGLSIFMGFSLGTAAWCLNICLLLTAFLTARQHIGWTTVYNSLLCGPFIDLMDRGLALVTGSGGGLLSRGVLFAGGLLLVASSCALMIRRCPGMSVNDAIATGFSKRLGCSFRVVRMSIDGFLMVTGFLMGGVVGIGSVIAVLCTGPLIQWFCGFDKKG